MQWMNLHHLKYFLVIAEEGSLTAASKKLLVGQPALSAQLKQFEEWLGFPLFKREGKRLIITSQGEYVLHYARSIKSLEDELVGNLAHADQLRKTTLTIGVQESVPKTVIAKAVSTLKTVEDVFVKIIEGTGDELFELIVSDKIELFIGNFRPLNDRKEMLYTSLAKESVSVWGSKKFEHFKAGFPDSLDGLSFTLPGFQNPIRHDFERYMLEAGLHFEVGIEAQDTALQKELAANGQGLIVMGEDSVRSWVNSAKLMRIGDLPDISEEYWLGIVKRSLDDDLIKTILKTYSK